MKNIIYANNAPSAIGPYSQAVAANGFIFTAGQIAIDPATGQLVQGDIKTQTRQVLKNVQAILEAGGASLQSVVKTTVFLKDMNEFSAMNEVYNEFFSAKGGSASGGKDSAPARSTYQDTNIYRSRSEYRLSDLRSGIGTREGVTHRFITALQWNIEPRVNMSLGLQLDVQNQETRTSEGVIAVRRSLYSSSSTGYWPYSYSGFHRAAEEKTLQWDFETSVTRVQIPFILRWRTSDIIELLFGINRRMSRWQINETTLALFKYQELTQDSVTTRRTNFGERYVTPTERTSDVETAFLGGLTVTLFMRSTYVSLSCRQYESFSTIRAWICDGGSRSTCNRSRVVVITRGRLFDGFLNFRGELLIVSPSGASCDFLLSFLYFLTLIFLFAGCLKRNLKG